MAALQRHSASSEGVKSARALQGTSQLRLPRHPFLRALLLHQHQLPLKRPKQMHAFMRVACMYVCAE